MLKKKAVLLFMLCAMGMMTACGQKKETAEREPDKAETVFEEEQEEMPEDSGKIQEPPETEEDTESPEAAGMKKLFGEACIADQTFELTLSEYSGKVYFVPFAPSEENQDFSMQIIQDGQVLTEINPYVPVSIAGKKFSSLDAAAFYDINYDGNTDIVLIETYENTSFAAVYCGFSKEGEEYEKYFFPEEQMSEALTSQVKPLTIPEIRNFLTGGKKNGEFTGYQEAYEAVSRLCDLKNSWAMEETYNLIYFDEDEIPELVAGVDGYNTSLYTYHDGSVSVLMDSWPYGAMGNSGYEYCPKKNSLRNYNTDYAGAILYTTYMEMDSNYTMETVAQITFYNFDDVNQNGMPDENEMETVGKYGMSYIDGKAATDEQCASYEKGAYEYMQGSMSLEELRSELQRK